MGSPPAEGFGLRFALPVILGPALNSINTTMIAVALVPIARATGTSASDVVLLVASVYLASAIAQPTLGRIVDLCGPRKVYVLGMAVAAVAGLIPVVFPTFVGALVSRVVIGIGTSGVYPAVMTSIRNRSVSSRREAPRALYAAVSVSGLVSASIGPVLGGVLVEHFGWQAIFVVNAPYAVTAMALALLWLPSDRTHVRPTSTAGEGRRPRPLDLPGLLLSTVAIGAEPALVRTYARLFLVHTCVYLVIYGLTPWLQSAAGYAADAAGWMQVPAVVLAGTAAALVSRSRGIRVPLIAAASVPIVGGLLLTVTTHTAPVWFLLIVIALFGPPQGLSAVSNQVAIQGQAPTGRMGSVAGMSRTAVQVGAIAASGIIGAAFGSAATDSGLHLIGWVIVALATAALLLTITDPALRPSS